MAVRRRPMVSSRVGSFLFFFFFTIDFSGNNPLGKAQVPAHAIRLHLFGEIFVVFPPSDEGREHQRVLPLPLRDSAKLGIILDCPREPSVRGDTQDLAGAYIHAALLSLSLAGIKGVYFIEVKSHSFTSIHRLIA